MRNVDRFMLVACLAAGLVFCMSAAGLTFVELSDHGIESHATPVDEFDKLSTGARVVETGVEPPALIEKVNPTYPAEMRAARISGKVVLQAIIDEEGKVGGVQVLKSSSHAQLDNAAIDAVRGWRYRPATSQGSPVKVYFTVVVDFSMDAEQKDPSPEAAPKQSTPI